MNPVEVRNQLDQVFNKKRVGHRIAKAVTEQVYRSVLTADKERVIALLGPAGVGKSTVIEKVRSLLLDVFRPDMEADPGFLPFLYLSTKPGLDADFNWKDLYARLLSLANEPLIGAKRRFAYRLDGQEIATTKGLPREELSRVFEDVVRNRRVRIVFFDEASSMINAQVNKNIIRQFNTLKALAVSLGLVIVLIGAYDMTGIDRGNGQLLRRSQLIHMPRYRRGEVTMAKEGDTDLDEEAFEDAVKTLAEVAPVTKDADIFLDQRFIFTMSVGCVGIFRDWLREACVQALCMNGGRLTRAIFEAAAPSKKKVVKYTREAELGELETSDISEEALAKELGLDSIRSTTPAANEEPAPKVGKRRTGRVGLRGPGRDPAGALRA